MIFKVIETTDENEDFIILVNYDHKFVWKRNERIPFVKEASEAFTKYCLEKNIHGKFYGHCCGHSSVIFTLDNDFVLEI
jgi:hypothetical protein